MKNFSQTKPIARGSILVTAAFLAACGGSEPSQNPGNATANSSENTLPASAVNKRIKASGPQSWDNLVQEGTAVAGAKYTASFRIKGAGTVTLRFFEGVAWINPLATLDCTASSVWKTCTVPVTMKTNPKFVFNITNSGPTVTPPFTDDAKLTDTTGKNILLNSGFEAATVAPWWSDSSFTLASETIADPPPVTGTYKWKNVEVGGGMVTGIAIHPKVANLVYVRTDVGEIFRWNEATGSWTPLFDGFGAAQGGYSNVESLALDPQNPNIVYAAGGNGKPSTGDNTAILKSIDRGATWKALKTDLIMSGNGELRSGGERLAVDPTAVLVQRAVLEHVPERRTARRRQSDAQNFLRLWQHQGVPSNRLPHRQRRPDLESLEPLQRWRLGGWRTTAHHAGTRQ